MSRPPCLPLSLFGLSLAPLVLGGVLFLAGCSTGIATPAPSPGLPASGGGGTTAAATPVPLLPATQKNLYVVQAGHNPISTLVFPLTAASGSSPLYEIPGSQVAVDGAGNIYVLDQENYPTYAVHSINVYSAASPTGKPIRSLPVGPGTKISDARVMTVSKAGEIYVNDGTGIAVFDATATGDADPVRYIQAAPRTDGAEGPAKIFVNYMSVDDAGNLFVGSNRPDFPIMVFGPKDTGAVAPARAIGGSQTSMGSACSGWGILGMAVNDTGEIYVLYVCYTDHFASDAPITLYKFGAVANGNVAPDKLVRLGGPHYGGGLALDSAGNIYIKDGGAVYSYASGSSGDALAWVFTSPALSMMPPPPGEDDWFDPSGTIVLH